MSMLATYRVGDLFRTHVNIAGFYDARPSPAESGWQKELPGMRWNLGVGPVFSFLKRTTRSAIGVAEGGPVRCPQSVANRSLSSRGLKVVGW
jgi:hypothetical protein